MTRLGMVGMIIVTAMVGGCAAKQQPAPPPLRIVHEAPPAPAGPRPPTASEILAAQPAEVREAIKEHDQKGEWPSYRTRSSVLYPYGEGPQPVIDCAALRTTISRSAIRSGGWRRRRPPATRAVRFRTSR